MPVAMSVVWDVIKANKSKDLAELLLDFDRVLGLQIDKKYEIELPEDVKKLIEERNVARSNKNWAESDRLREEIYRQGYVIKDTKDGYTIELCK